MDKVNAGIVKLMNLTGSSYVNGNVADFSVKREPVFNALLERKTKQVRGEEMSSKNVDRGPGIVEREVVLKRDPTAKKGEDETCDVAREVAAAQMIWLPVSNVSDLQIPAQQEKVMSIEMPMIFATNDDPSAVLSEEVLAQFAAKIPVVVEMPEGEDAPALEAELLPDQVIEAVPEEIESQLQTNIGEQKTEEMSVEVRVTENEADDADPEVTVAETPLFEKVEAAPIKVADAPERTEKAPELEKQVADRLVRAFESGETKVQIQLDPAELGKLTIELTRNTDGTLNILLNAESVETRGLLERHVGGLQEVFAERGQNGVQITVNQNEESQRQDNGNQHNDFQDGSNGRQSEQHRRDDRSSGEDFLQQLRLGLIPIEEEKND